MAIRPFANAPHADKNSIATNWLIGVQTGNTPNAVNQMKYLTVDEFTAYVRSTYGSMWNYRGDFSSATPTDPEVNDYFVCTGNFTEDGQSFVSGHVYAYNGNTWGDVSNVFLQYVKQSDFETLSDDVDAIDDRLTEAEQRIDAMTGMVFKGDTTRANLPTASASNQGWVYYLTDEGIYVASNGTQWVTVMNYVVQTITEGDTTHAPSGDAVHNEFETLHEAIKTLSEWDVHSDTDMVFEGELDKTWEDMENQIPLAENDATADVAEIAIKARQDEDGNDIVETYALKADVEALTQRVSANSKRITNLELNTGDQFNVTYPSDTYGLDEVPASVEPFAKVKKLRGVSVAWNEQYDADITGQTSYLQKNSSTEIQARQTFGTGIIYLSYPMLTNNHIYMIEFDGTFPSFRYYYDTSYSYSKPIAGKDAYLYKPTALNGTRGILTNTDTVNSGAVLKTHIHDLTQMFGPAVADYLYSIEQATTGAGVALFKALVSAQDNSHETGRLVSTTYEAVGSEGKNLVESIYQVSGSNPYAVVLFADAELEPSTTYTISFVGANGNSLYTNEYLFNIVSIVCNGTRQSLTVTTKSEISHSNSNQYQNGRWMLFKNSGTNTVNPHFSNVQIEKGSTATDYSSFFTDTLPLPTSVTLRGILKMQNNNLVVDGDEYEPSSGDIGRGYGIIDLGSLNWNKTTSGSYSRFISDGIASLIASPASNSAVPDWMPNAKGYASQSFSDMYYGNYDKSIGVTDKQTSGTGNIHIIDSAYNDYTTDQFKTAMSGIYLVYPLATPTSESVTPIIDPFIHVEGGGSVDTEQTNDPKIASAMTLEYMAS